jgi:hypothetical protein
MTPEVVHDQNYDVPPQRRPHGHAAIGCAKRGNKKRSLRTRSNPLGEELESDEVDEEDK